MTPSSLLPDEPCHAQTPQCGFIGLSPHGRVTQITPCLAFSPTSASNRPQTSRDRDHSLSELLSCPVTSYLFTALDTEPPDDCKASAVKRLPRFIPQNRLRQDSRITRSEASVLVFVCFWVCLLKGNTDYAASPELTQARRIWECCFPSDHKWELRDCVLT